MLSLLLMASYPLHPTDLETPIASTVSLPFAEATPIFLFDLNGVLFDTDSTVIVRQLGLTDVILFLTRYGSVQLIKLHFYHTLNRITNSSGNHLNIKDPQGIIMPQLMIDWLRGTIDNKTALTHTVTTIEANSQWFLSGVEQRLMIGMAHALFDPEKFVASRKFLIDLAPLIGYLKRNGAKLYILSNWDQESFELLKKRYPAVFNWFDGAIISGTTGYIKPEPELFAHVQNTYQTNLICFLDDQHENLTAAAKVGWHPIHVMQVSSLFGLTSKIDTTTIITKALSFFKKYHNRQPSPAATTPDNCNKEIVHA
jgi:HAD superfamily hydrolase (TIGR01509 family)